MSDDEDEYPEGELPEGQVKRYVSRKPSYRSVEVGSTDIVVDSYSLVTPGTGYVRRDRRSTRP